MQRAQRCFLASGCSPRRRQRRVAEGSPPGEPIGHALAAVRHKRRRRAVTYRKYALRAPRRPQRRPLRAPWSRILGAATTAMSLHRRGTATTKTGPCRRNPLGRWGSRPISALLVVDDARASTPPRALTSAREPLRAPQVENPTGHGTSPPSRRNPVRYAG